MLYDKLPIVFLSTIVSEKNGTTNATIASFILDHLNEMQSIGIKEMAEKCNVAISSISRFCKEIGLRDFAELKELILSTNLYYEEPSSKQNSEQRMEDYALKIQESIKQVQQSIDLHQIEKLCEDIKHYQNVSIFGLLKAASVAFNLQSDLLMLGKQSYSNIAYAQQLAYILSATKNDLIIIFSYTGSYFEYQNLRALQKKLEAPKIWMISSGKKTYPSYINEVILFDSKQDQISHPYQLQFIASLIAQEYARRCEK